MTDSNKTPQVTATLSLNGLSLVVDNEPFTINDSHANFDKIIEALKSNNFEAIPDLLNAGKHIEDLSEGRIKVIHGVVHFNNHAIHNSVTTRLLKTIELGFDARPLARFLDRLMNNPSHHSVTQLYGFMDACDLPITQDGRLLAYRSVKDNYWDTHTGKTSLSVPPNSQMDRPKSVQGDVMVVDGVTTRFLPNGATEVSMPRNMVDDNPNRTCSNGLHVCSQKYGMYGTRLLLVAVDPADVVSVPNDYNQAKMRVCKYEVLKDVQHKGFETYEKCPVYDDADIDWEDEDESEDGVWWNL